MKNRPGKLPDFFIYVGEVQKPPQQLNSIALIQRGRGTGPVKPRQPVRKNKVPIPAETIWKMRGDY